MPLCACFYILCQQFVAGKGNLSRFTSIAANVESESDDCFTRKVTNLLSSKQTQIPSNLVTLRSLRVTGSARGVPKLE